MSLNFATVLSGAGNLEKFVLSSHKKHKKNKQFTDYKDFLNVQLHVPYKGTTEHFDCDLL